ncbi:MAG TPA: hypothetical protein VFS80_12435 [Burkholderiales bacterium]|nr:hypothetical protein [Burkholderiales bacterium]
MKTRLKLLFVLAAAALLAPAVAQDIRLSVSGGIAPGVYGRVDIGKHTPPLVYPRAVLVVGSPKPPAPVYLHVPPGHARNWSKHCSKYGACNRPVFFVKSAEYEPGYRHPRNRGDKGGGKGKDR